MGPVQRSDSQRSRRRLLRFLRTRLPFPWRAIGLRLSDRGSHAARQLRAGSWPDRRDAATRAVAKLGQRSSCRAYTSRSAALGKLRLQRWQLASAAASGKLCSAGGIWPPPKKFFGAATELYLGVG